jgi:hypothetical protein
MSLPAGIPTVRVHGRYLMPDGRGHTGSIRFKAPPLLTYQGDKLFVAGAVCVPLDESGRFEVALPATDAPGMSPREWAYLVTEDLQGVVSGRIFSLALPAGSPPIDLATVGVKK